VKLDLASGGSVIDKITKYGYLQPMIKTLLTFLLGLMAHQAAIAQYTQDTVVYYMKNSGKAVNAKDSADYLMAILPGDSSTGIWAYPFTELYKNGKRKKVGYTLMQTQNLQLHGNILSFYVSGKKQSIIAYEKGQQIGNSVFYYPNGKLWKLTIEKDEPSNKPFPANPIRHVSILQECRDSTGKVLTENGNGIWINYVDDFTFKSAEGRVVNGREEGEWHGDLSDTTSYSCTYKNGEIAGIGYGFSKSGEKHPFTQVDMTPEFPKGIEAFGRFLSRNINFPWVELEKGIRGRVVVKFVVEKNGQLVDLNIIRSPGARFSAEVLRVLKLSPTWTPGYQYGFPVRVSYTVPVEFN
jgi:TonB family protein